MQFHPSAFTAALLLAVASTTPFQTLAQITDNDGIPPTSVTIPIGSDPNSNPPTVGWTEGLCYIPLTTGVHPGDSLLFEFDAHNVYQLASKDHFDNCDFTNATLLAQVGESPFTYTIPSEAMGDVLYFACQVGDHCAGGTQKLQVGVSAFWGITNEESTAARVAPASSFVLGTSLEECEAIQQNSGAVSELDQIEASALQSYCSDPVLVEEGGEAHTYYRTCLSGPATLTPGGVINRLFVMQDPFPQDYRVVIGQRTFEFVEGDPDSELGISPVPVNQLYVHHLSGSVVFGQGTEGVRRTAPDAPFPKPYGLLSGSDGNTMIFHLIDLRQVDDWLSCIECRCDQQAPGTYLDELTRTGNITGGVNCCTNCTDIETQTVDYRMRYNITYRELQPGDEPVTDVRQLTADISPMAGGILEHDVPSEEYLPEDQRSPENPAVQRLEIVKPFNEIFKEEFFQRPYGLSPTVQLLRCVAHLHVAAIEMWLEDAATGERICDGKTTYGTDPDSDAGFLTAVSVSDYNPPKEFPEDLMVRFVTDYNATNVHTGVMGYWFLFVAGDDHVSAKETNVTVELCMPSTCDASLLPTMDITPFLEQQENAASEGRELQTECVDTLAESPSCTFGGVCDCESFVNAEESTGCNGFHSSTWGDIEVRSVCANYCGCDVSAAVEGAVDSASNTATIDEDCVDALAEHPSCTFGGMCDCEAFVNAPESTGCGGVYTSSMGDIEIDSVCNNYCGCTGGSAPVEVESDCEDTLADHPSCTFGGMCDCETFVNADESTGCGGIYASDMGDIKINAVCDKYCGCTGGSAQTVEENNNAAGAPTEAQSSTGGLGGCEDTLASHPACRFAGVCSCEEFVNAEESEGCGGLYKTEMGDTVINDVCASYCDACVVQSAEELFEEAYAEVMTLTMQDHCRYATKECQSTLSNLFACANGQSGIENLDPMVQSFVIKHGNAMALENAKLGTPSLHVGKEDQTVEVCSIELEVELDGSTEDVASSATTKRGSMTVLGLSIVSFFFV